MSSRLRGTVVVVFGIIVSMGVLGCRAPGRTGEPPSATLVAPQRTTTYHVRNVNGQMVAVTVPAFGPPNVKMSNPAAGTVPATVMALDEQRSQAQVQTQQGQRLVLTLPPELFAPMRVGDHFLLQVVQPTSQ